MRPSTPTDNALVTFRFKHQDVAMEAAEEEFDAAGRKFRAGSFIVKNADRAVLEPTLTSLGLSGAAMAAAPAVRTHNLDVPRIGYIHSWANTQNEGWVRAALDTYGVPYTYFADITLREGNLRQKYDVIVYPHVGGSAQSQVNGLPKTGGSPLPYMKTADTPNLGAIIGGRHPRRHGVGRTDGAGEVVREGGTLITGGRRRQSPRLQRQQRRHRRESGGAVRRGSVMRGVFTYGAADRLRLRCAGAGLLQPDTVLNVSGGGGFGGRVGRERHPASA